MPVWVMPGRLERCATPKSLRWRSAVLVEQDIGRLQVAVDHAQVVGAPQGVCQLQADLHAAPDRFAPALRLQPGCQRAAADVLHHQVVLTAFFDGIDVADDIGVIELAQGFALVLEAQGDLAAELGHIGFEEVDRHRCPLCVSSPW